MNQSTNPSIGCIIKGIEPRPIAVGVQAATAAGRATGLLDTPNREKRTIVFIVAPGMKTEARDCHNSVSTVDTAASKPAEGEACRQPSW